MAKVSDIWPGFLSFNTNIYNWIDTVLDMTYCMTIVHSIILGNLSIVK